MRNVLALATAFVLAGCGSPNGSKPISDGGANLDGHLDTSPGTAGSTCATACDCQPGLSCTSGVCANGGAAAYCCESSSCPAGAT
ncbi:MAG TPA: hypothetical protein VFF06_34755 [Polyangia bacterium]|nr:hypothetical protein [Polyangia bacterium]